MDKELFDHQEKAIADLFTSIDSLEKRISKIEQERFSLRDQFAIQYQRDNPGYFATYAYQFADEMLAARQDQGGE